MADITHLDADKGSDVVYYQRHVIGNFIELLAEIRAQFVDLAARHDVWTAEMKAEARQAPKDEAERLQRVWAFLRGTRRVRRGAKRYYMLDRSSVVRAGGVFPNRLARRREACTETSDAGMGSTPTTAASPTSTATFASIAPAAEPRTLITIPYSAATAMAGLISVKRPWTKPRITPRT